ncbi:MAG TPA: T9SS type A sorting domain-containing protein, partial [Candidatus Marinimicrobia bacterium]|nr:T9SS type A sorting domain-containing protein [Candidatus Neomarinimicrobiota bacterium]
WDNANNPSEKEIKLYRTQVNKLEIYNAYNFPNPFATSTQFTFEVTQNIDLTLDLYTLGGRRIKSFEKFNLSAGYHTIDWDGLDSFGGNIANGVYLYRLKAIGDESTVSYIGRCAKYQ